MRIVLIDPCSPEFNRGSFCYSPYLFFNGLYQEHDITFFETFRIEDFDQLPVDADVYIVSLWSYPQIDAAFLLAQMIPFSFKKPVYFIGYDPLISVAGLPSYKTFFDKEILIDSEFLRTAMKQYPINYSKFNRLLLSDCDMHLKSKETTDKVYPLFTSYGCPNSCQFCPSTVNCNKTRTALSITDVYELFVACREKGIKYIHFTDEDFFFSPPRTFSILEMIKKEKFDFHMIALGSASTVKSFTSSYGQSIIKDAGLELIEIGFESADEEVNKTMGTIKKFSTCADLAWIQKNLPLKERINIFWLVQTFFPGETIDSLNQTGLFMKEYGYNMNEVVGRLRTNGTKGGLGQFFQIYHGTPIFEKAKKHGMVLTENPMRLIPSYLPNSFLLSTIRKVNKDKMDDAFPWLELYNVSHLAKFIRKDTSVFYYISSKPVYTQIQYAITLAILARFGVIE